MTFLADAGRFPEEISETCIGALLVRVTASAAVAANATAAATGRAARTLALIEAPLQRSRYTIFIL
jgi:hypothetical protein